MLSIPFAIGGRWGLLGIGLNNDLGLHLAWAEWLRSGFGPTPDAGYPLGPHGLAVATAAAFRESASARPSSARSSRSASSPASPPSGRCRASARAGGYWRRRWSPSPTSPPPTSPRAPSRSSPRRSSSSPSPSACATSSRLDASPAPVVCPGWRSRAGSSSPTASPASPGRCSPPSSGASRCPRCGGRWRRGRCCASSSGRRRCWRSSSWRRSAWRRPRSARSASAAASAKSPAPTPTVRSRRSRRSASGRRPTTDSKRPGGAHLTGLAGAIGLLALLAGGWWWVRRRDLAVPLGPRRLRPPLPRGAADQRRLLARQGADDRRPAGDAGHRPPPARRVPRSRAADGARTSYIGGNFGPSTGVWRVGWGVLGGGLHRRRGLLELPGAAQRARGARRPRRRAAGVPADRPRAAGALRRPGPLRRLRAARRRHARAAGRVPRPGRRPEPGEALRHRRRLQPDRLRLLLTRDARQLPLRDHRPSRLEQRRPARLQAHRRHALLRPLEADRRRARRPPRAARGHERGRPRRLRLAGDPHPALQSGPGLPLPRAWRSRRRSAGAPAPR